MTAGDSAPPVFPLNRGGVWPPGEYMNYRESEPVKLVETPFGTRAWLITRYRDVRGLLRGDGLSSDPRRPDFPTFVAFRRLSAEGATLRNPIVDMDEPEHARYRRIVAPDLTVKAILRLVPRIERVVDTLLDDIEANGAPVDLMASFCADLPSQIVCEMLGFPAEEREYFRRLAEDIQAERTDASRRVEIHREMNEYVAAKVAAREQDRGDEFIDRLLDARDRGDIPPEEVVNVARGMYSAGVGTTANAIALSVVALLMHPEQAALIAHPDTDLPRAVEELMRWTSIVHGLARIALQRLEVDGQAIEEGDGVLLALPSANHDPSIFADPDRLDITREPSDQLGFGQGIHQCPGQQLARIELQIALSRLFRRFPSLRLDQPMSNLQFKQGFVHGVETLPVAW